jgi:hypothetical protein
LGLDLVTLDTLDEAKSFISMCQKSSLIAPGDDPFVGGMASSVGDWRWISTGKKIDYAFPWLQAPYQPDNGNKNEWCMNFLTAFKMQFNDCPCYGTQVQLKFVCQMISKTPAKV